MFDPYGAERTVDERGRRVRRFRALAGTSAGTQGLRPDAARCPPPIGI
jgi:hypothetical protein